MSTGGFQGLGRRDVVTAEELTSVDDYLATVMEQARPLEPLELRLQDALGLVLAEDVSSAEPVPSFANSAMDGYALRAADIVGATVEEPVVVEVTGEVPAGATGELPTVERNRAVRIMTGAPLPPGADTVVPVENTSNEDGRVRIHVELDAGTHVRRVGEDVSPGERLLPAGRRLLPADIGLLAAVGVARVPCRPAPRVVVLSTGDELVSAERRPTTGQIRDANGPMLSALVRQAGGIPYHAGIIADDRKALHRAFDSNRGHADLIVATGGVSAGSYDLIEETIGRLGSVTAVKVAMKPGMPQVLGRIGDITMLGLPGNPVSAFVSFEVFVRPLLGAMQGRADLDRPRVNARITERVTAPPHKRTFVRVSMRRREGRWEATPTGPQGSHLLTSIAGADALAEIPEDRTEVDAGEDVRVRLLMERA